MYSVSDGSAKGEIEFANGELLRENGSEVRVCEGHTESEADRFQLIRMTANALEVLGRGGIRDSSERWG